MITVRRKRKNQHAVYAIYPVGDCYLDCESGRLNPDAELGRVVARSFNHAVSKAKERGIDQGREIWAIEVPSMDRIIIPPAGSVTVNNDDAGASQID
jgi:hypothetical protein